MQSRSFKYHWILIGAIVGGAVGFTLLFMLGNSSPELFHWLHWPLDFVVDWLADTFYRGNTDQLIGLAVPLLLVYWGIIGATAGAIAAAGRQWLQR